MLLALIMATIILGLLFSGWLTPTPGKAQPNQSNPTNSVETTNCIASSTTTNCTEAAVNFGSNSVAECGLPVTITVSLTNTAGLVIIDTSYTNTGNSGAGACPDTFTTNTPAPKIISEMWWDSSSTNSGTNLSASFTPAVQSGSVTFTVVWQHVACDTNTEIISTSVGYNVPCPTITNCTVINECAPPGNTGAKIGYNFNCAKGWHSWESVIDVTTGNFVKAATNSAYLDWAGGDKIYNGGSPGGSYTDVTIQTIYFALVGGGGTTNNNSVCSFNNTQTITVTQTNTSYPPHGIVTTTVTIGGGATATCYY